MTQTDQPATITGFEAGKYPYSDRLKRGDYESQKAALQAELLKVQIWAAETGERFVLLFEGRDAAGKGGTIKRFTEQLKPRLARVVALNKPTDEERGQWFSNAISNTCHRTERSFSMIVPVTTVPASNGSWGSASRANTSNSCARHQSLNGC